MADRPPDASVVVLTKNAGPTFRDFLQRVFSQKTGFGFEVIVVDSGSTDETTLIAADFPAKLITINPADFNHGLTRNFGASQAAGEYVLFLTQDALPKDENWLEFLMKPLREDELVAGSYSRQEPRPDADPITVDKMGWSSVTGTERRVKYAPVGSYASLPPGQRLDLAGFDNVSSCVRKSVLQSLPFPITGFAEDLLWGKSAIEQGYKLVFEPDSVVIHSHSRSIKHDYQRSRLSSVIYHRSFGVRGVQTWREFVNDLRGCLLHRMEVLRKAGKPVIPFIGDTAHMFLLSVAECLGRWQGSRR